AGADGRPGPTEEAPQQPRWIGPPERPIVGAQRVREVERREERRAGRDDGTVAELRPERGERGTIRLDWRLLPALYPIGKHAVRQMLQLDQIEPPLYRDASA